MQYARTAIELAQMPKYGISVAGHTLTLSAGYFADGSLAEIFLNARHIGSPLEAIAGIQQSSHQLRFNTAPISRHFDTR